MTKTVYVSEVNEQAVLDRHLHLRNVDGRESIHATQLDVLREVDAWNARGLELKYDAYAVTVQVVRLTHHVNNND